MHVLKLLAAWRRAVPNNNDPAGFDIALVRMNGPVVLNSFTRPAQLYRGDFPLNFHLAAAGWGKACLGTNCSPQSLKSGLMQVVEDGSRLCDTPNFFNRPPSASLLCADPLDGSTCRGDSGGYLGGTDSNGVHFVVGVTSFGPGNCWGRSAFSSVTHYFNWIMNIGG